MNFQAFGRAATLLCMCGLAVCAQTDEVTSKDTPFTFRSGVNMVAVPVVVRDARGTAVGNLSIDDFQLFDNGKPQMISKFSVETIVKESSAAKPAVAPKPAEPTQTAVPDSSSTLTDVNTDGIPDRFVAYLFDDVHISLGNLVSTRDAARRQIDTSLHALDRAAIYTTSGHVIQEFTSDKEKLHAALAAISAGQAMANKALRENTCPPVEYYMADRIYNHHDLTAWKIATKDAMYCGGGGSTDLESSDVQETDIAQCEISGSTDGVCLAARNAKSAARAAVIVGDQETETSFGTLRAVVARMASMPGQRSLIVISPGFLVLDDKHDEQMAIIDRAIKANVVIGGLDSRGLYPDLLGGDASDRTNSKTIAEKHPYQALATIQQTDVMATLAEGTGGSFYHGTNDYDEAFARVATAPGYICVLGFSPLDLKLDGKYHNLKVTLKSGRGLELQVRKGYYAPSASTDPADKAKQDIEEAFFSREEVHDLPAVLQTQYFKLDDGDASLSAVSKVDVKKLNFHKDGDRNRNDITVVTGLFDNDGNFMTGAQKVLEMRLLDETLAKRVGSGISVKNSFTVHPGRYVVRVVVRDSEGQTMSAQSSLVEIP